MNDSDSEDAKLSIKDEFRTHINEEVNINPFPSPTSSLPQSSLNSTSNNSSSPSPIPTSPPLKCLPAACIFVASISPRTTQEQLQDHFQRLYGPVVRTSIRSDNKSRMQAFVQFIHVEHAKAALEDSNRQSLNGHRIRIHKAKVNTTLFVAHVERTIRNPQLRKIFEEYGEVDHVNLLTDPTTRQSKGCGFVRFVYREDAKEALEKIQTKFSDWIVEWSKSADSSRTDEHRLSIFVAGPDVTLMNEDMLRKKFSQYGKIVSINVVHPKGDEKKVFAFVHFRDQKSTFLAIENENSTEWEGQLLRVELPETTQARQEKRQKREQGVGGGSNQMMMPPPNFNFPNFYPFFPPPPSVNPGSSSPNDQVSSSASGMSVPSGFPYFPYLPMSPSNNNANSPSSVSQNNEMTSAGGGAGHSSMPVPSPDPSFYYAWWYQQLQLHQQQFQQQRDDKEEDDQHHQDHQQRHYQNQQRQQRQSHHQQQYHHHHQTDHSKRKTGNENESHLISPKRQKL